MQCLQLSYKNLFMLLEELLRRGQNIFSKKKYLKEMKDWIWELPYYPIVKKISAAYL